MHKVLASCQKEGVTGADGAGTMEEGPSWLARQDWRAIPAV